MGDRTRVGSGCFDLARLNGERAVGWKPVGPVLELLAQYLANQQRAKAGAVDEQVARDLLTRFEDQRLDIAALAMLAHIGNLALDPLHSRLFGEPAQVPAVKPGIQMVGIIERHLLRRTELARRGRLVLEAIFTNVPRHPELARAQPEMLEVDHPGRPPDRPERMDVAVSLSRPVLEGN